MVGANSQDLAMSWKHMQGVMNQDFPKYTTRVVNTAMTLGHGLASRAFGRQVDWKETMRTACQSRMLAKK